MNKLWILIGSLFLCTGYDLWGQQVSNPIFEAKIRSTIDFTIPIISCNLLQDRLQEQEVFLLDAREEQEYNVSHIDQAIHVGYDHFDLQKLRTIPKHAILIVYCSIGYRSEKIGERIKAMGYTKVYNLYGGIFEWVNTGQEVVDKTGQSTKYIHTYNQEWSKYVYTGKKVY
ncbi:MAG: rhodanese-like domain-containing protein [Saprospiraceae bacterium]|nr:rhodanese-like domain-containing protein [Saprospiraceae bacterium]